MGHGSLDGLIGFAFEAGQLRRLPRAGWPLAGVADGESVAEHSFRTAVLAYLISHQEGANAEHAAVLGLFHDFPEARTGDVPSVGRPYVKTVDPREVIADQAAGLPTQLGKHIVELIAEHESAKEPNASLEAVCSRDADKLDCLLAAREYQAAGNTMMQPWIDSMVRAVTTATGTALAEAAQRLEPSVWWNEFAARFGTARMTDRPGTATGGIANPTKED